MAAPLIAIFGAAVLPNGRPSQALLRRTLFGLEAARRRPDAPILCSGGVGRAPPSEASVMAQVLREGGVPEDRLILDEASRDTLQSVVVVAAQVRRQAHPRVVVCSDAYHLPRIRMMLGLLGVAADPGPVWPGGSWTHHARMTLREGLAIPYDLAIVLARRRELSPPEAS
jgi:uncharacterized SAM-binding protein YcdF (DUF218 family)